MEQQQQQQTDSSSSSEEPSSDAATRTADAIVRTPDAADADADAFSVISGDASPHGSVFDFLTFGHADPAPFSLFTPSPGLSKSGIASSPLTRHTGSALSSPSRFFRSPFNATGAQKKRARKHACQQLRAATADAGDRSELDPRASASSTCSSVIDDADAALAADSNSDAALHTPARKPRGPRADVKEEIPQLMDMMSLSCTETLLSPWPRSTLFAATPSPPSRVQLLSRRLKEDFDRERGAPASAGGEAAVDDADNSLGDDELYRSAPSGLAGDQDSFFSFANSLSPLVHADEFESSFLSVRLSPLVSLDSYELPRLIPPFPMPRLDDDATDAHADTRAKKSLGSAGVRSSAAATTTASTPKTPMIRQRVTSAGYSSGSSRSSSSASSILSESFPNIQASTSATPGKDERSKIGSHSIMTMKLHVAGGASTLSHSKREIEAINDSLRKKSRKRKLEDKRSGLFKAVAPVQRKLLQTPLKASPSRSPLSYHHHAWSDRTAHSDASSHHKSAAEMTPQKTEHGGTAYSVLAIHSTPSSSASTRHSIAGASTPVTSALLMTPSSNWKKSRSIPPSGFTPGGASTTPQSLRTRRTPLRHAASISTVLPVATVPTAGASQQLVTETPRKTPAPGKKAPLPTSAKALTTPTPTHRAHDSSVSLGTATAATAALVTKPKKAPCNCKKSKCLKLYCECFASGGYCDENCNCQGCANTPATETIRQQAIAARLEKNPNAFKPKIESTAVLSGALTPGSARAVLGGASGGAFATPVGNGKLGSLAHRSGDLKKMHKHGCHCKKSACQKKYCECFQAGVPCGDNCRCIDCKNQAPCASHASGGTVSTGTTPSRLNDVDETFVSPVLRNVRHRLRIDRETWSKNFSSPFEVSPRRERERNERLRSQQLRARLGGSSAATLAAMDHPSSSSSSSSIPSGGDALSVRLTSVPAAAAFTTPTLGVSKRQKLSVSPVSESTPRAAATLSGKSHVHFATMSTEKQMSGQCSRRLSSAALATSASAATDRVLLYPLFGSELPPVKSAVSAKIFHCLTNADLYNASLVSKLWSQVALGDTVWDHANFLRAPVESTGSDADLMDGVEVAQPLLR